MNTIATILPYIQIILSVILIVSVLLQQSSSGLGGVLGGGDDGGLYHTRRGFEKFLFYTTIVVSVLFAVSSFATVIIK